MLNSAVLPKPMTTGEITCFPFGFTNPLGIELTNELNGNIPEADYFNRIYGKGHWNYLTIRSLAIGQGELLITPIQMANMTATHG